MSSDNWKSEYPFESNWLRVGDHQCHFVDEGQGDPILLVHGNPTWSFYWRKLITAAMGSKRAVAPDHLGSGQSDKPSGYTYRLSDHTANLSKLISKLDLNRITLVVHDWGGAIGLGAAVANPERFARIVLLNTAAFPPPYIPWRIRACRIPFLGALGVRGLNLFARAAQTMTIHDRSTVNEAALAGLIAPYNSWQNRIGIHRFVKDIPDSPNHPTYAVLDSLERNLENLKHLPIKIIWGMRDWCFRPDCLERFESIFPHANSIRLEDVGHWVMEEAPDIVIREVLSFTESARRDIPLASANWSK